MLELMDILWTVFIQREIKLVTNNRIQLKCNTCLIAGLIAGLRLDSKLCVESTGLGPEPTSCREPVRWIWNLALLVHLSYCRLLHMSLQRCVVYFIIPPQTNGVHWNQKFGLKIMKPGRRETLGKVDVTGVWDETACDGRLGRNSVSLKTTCLER